MDATSAVQDYWKSKVDYFSGVARRAVGLDKGKIPDGFPSGETAVSWGKRLEQAFQSRITRLRSTQDSLDEAYADCTRDALNIWLQAGGPTQSSAFAQMTSALDALVLAEAGLDAVAGMLRPIQAYLAQANGGAAVPFPRDPPLQSRETFLATWTPHELARYLALRVVLIPAIQGSSVASSTLAESGDALTRSVRDAPVIERLAGYILGLSSASGTSTVRTTAPMIRVIQDARKYLTSPEMRGIPGSVGEVFASLEAQIRGISTGADQLSEMVATAPEKLKDQIQDLERGAQGAVSGAILVGIGVAVTVGGILYAISSRGSDRTG